MRWRNNIENNKLRVIKKFLFFPTKVNNETVWLENIYVLQKVTIGNPLFDDDAWWWTDIGYVDVETYNKLKLLPFEKFEDYVKETFSIKL